MLYEVLAEALAVNPCALVTPAQKLSGAQLLAAAEELAATLAGAGVRRLGLLMDNEAAWTIADLAALKAGLVLVPIPGFFSRAQQLHVIADAGLDAVLAPVALPMASQTLATGQGTLSLLAVDAPQTLPAGTAKITYTSGTTGNPKGVCLSEANMLAVCRSLLWVTGQQGVERHLCLLPLAVLLENLGGLYVPWLAGASVTLVPMAELGVKGASGLDPAQMLSTLTRYQPHSLILVPALLPVILAGKAQGLADSYRFLALGGGKTAQAQLEQAQALGLPLYEGYGLSEACSVVALNIPGANKPGTVGQVLPHVEVRLAEDGEVQVRGNSFLGYLGEEGDQPQWLATGDLGALAEDGTLTILGRKKATIVTAMGRNVAPEWLEAELCALPGIAQAFVYGSESQGLHALVVTGREDLATLKEGFNQGLPDYARLDSLSGTNEPFSIERQELTANGRLRRQALAQRIKESPMGFFDRLKTETQAAQQYLLSAPAILACQQGDVTLPRYLAFLNNAYHHVKHTVPLMMACGTRLGDDKEWLRGAIAEYIEEEYGHHEWILDDIAAAGGDREQARLSKANFETELMVAYAYDSVNRGNPVSLFGMVWVLEGTSVNLATPMADLIRAKLSLGKGACRYLYSHGSLDLEHIDFFESLMNRIEDKADQDAIIHMANRMYRLYGDMFRSLPMEA
ncbi:AMP-binding protein [Gallaecimonas xiamenensis]|uniref:Long-chain-fatty-acid-CoA ligase n=1 Tax=Gallaecimonas xiamenensis 3-C-1 TaxID=745411 RepID=K2IWQ5_9GAMM|nr:AMP-binding protein [Gallaecimonas xiamenensis]EKE74921.1 long-chain-fatty-acid-CoA ligase [Gallaecimonas xiamenensis 3-C-1]